MTSSSKPPGVAGSHGNFPNMVVHPFLVLYPALFQQLSRVGFQLGEAILVGVTKWWDPPALISILTLMVWLRCTSSFASVALLIFSYNTIEGCRWAGVEASLLLLQLCNQLEGSVFTKGIWPGIIVGKPFLHQLEK